MLEELGPDGQASTLAALLKSIHLDACAKTPADTPGRSPPPDLVSGRRDRLRVNAARSLPA